ncbi:rhodanese-like domain-containing protein [Vibrio amylolyticus]|uniref:rhodanese-like domain-containing protein n=1 Tax=Vibrio amylolyticus TaxID=2847292 RepID=UPI00354D0FFD
MFKTITSFTTCLVIALLSLSNAFASERAEIGWQKFEQGAVLIDVRTKEEFEQGHLDNAQIKPVQEIENWSQSLNKDEPIVLYCRSGNRSGIAYQWLKEKGFTNIHNAGGYSEMLQAAH